METLLKFNPSDGFNFLLESIHESSVDIVIVSLQPSTRYALFRIFARILDTLGKLAFVVGTPPGSRNVRIMALKPKFVDEA